MFVEIVRDGNHAAAFRVRRPDGSLTDITSRNRARDTATAILLAYLNGQETPVGGPPVAPLPEAAE